MERVKLLVKPKLNNAGSRTRPGDVRGKYDTKTPEERAERREKKARRQVTWAMRWQDKRAGRPSEYTPNLHDELVFDLRLAGLSAKQIAVALNVNLQTLEEWKTKHSTFFEAWLGGGDEADAVVSRALFERAVGYTHESEKLFFDAKNGEVIREDITEHYPPDTGAAQFWLTNRQQQAWKTRQSTELTGANGEPLQLPTISITPVKVVNKDG